MTKRKERWRVERRERKRKKEREGEREREQDERLDPWPVRGIKGVLYDAVVYGRGFYLIALPPVRISQ